MCVCSCVCIYVYMGVGGTGLLCCTMLYDFTFALFCMKSSVLERLD